MHGWVYFIIVWTETLYIITKYRKCGNFHGAEIFAVFVGTQITSKIAISWPCSTKFLVLLYFTSINYC